MSATLAKCSVGQAEIYMKDELVNEREIYYAQTENRAGQWIGKGAAKLGLKGDITKEEFSQMSRGINPTTGKRFRRITLGRTREAGGELKQVKEIAGWGLVISAPKSISIVALIGGDERVRQAHLDSATVAFERAEQQAQANLGGGKKEQTGNLITGRFSHDSARPSSKSGLVAPQLHEHFVIKNATVLPDGTIRPLEPSELYKAQSYIRTVYYVELADRLQKLGYEIEIDGETGAPEIAGISKEYRVACSPRRAEILELAKKAGRNFRQLGVVNRREKVFDKNLIREQHQGIDGFFDFQALRAVKKARETAPTIKPDSAKESVAFALAKLSKRESVFNPRVVLLEANKHGIGRTSVAAIEAELETRKKDGRIKTVRLRDGREAVFLSAEVEIEGNLSRSVKTVPSKETLRDEYFKNVTPKENIVIEKEFAKFNRQQQYALVDILNAETNVTILEECAGDGKTITLSFMGKMAEKANYEVLGLAPAIGAAQEFDNAKFTTLTLQKLLASSDLPRDHKRFFIADESSFVSSRQMDKFFRDAVKTGDRVLLVEDTRRREGVKAGKPPVPIQDDELSRGANVETIERQTKKSDCRTVKNLPEEKIIEAVTEMHERGQIREIKDRAERHNSIVEAFTVAPEKTLVVAPRNADRQAINLKIHTALKESGKIGKEEIEIKILRPRNDISATEREFAAAYEEGDLITYTRGSKESEIPAKSLARVTKIDRERNLLTVEVKDGGDGTEAREITYNPKRLRGVSVWTEETIKVSEGDRLQFRAPFEEKKTKIASGTMFEVSKITKDTLTLRNEKGKTVKLKTDQPHAIDYGYAAASQSSQEKTIDRILIHAESTESKQILNQGMAGVAVSRTRDEALIFTDDAEKLVEQMARQIEKTDISQVKAETIESVPERSPKIVFDTQPTVDKADRSEIKPTVILLSAEKSAMPAIVIESAQQTPVVSEVKPEAESKEIKPSAIVPLVEKSATPAIEVQPALKDAFPTSYTPSHNQEISIKELVQLSRTSAEEQGLFHSEKAWSWLETVEFPDLAARETPENHRQFVDFLQKDLPESERVNLSGKSELESTYAILKLIPIEKRETIVNGFFADYYKQQNEGERVIEHAPELAEKTVLDAKPEFAKTERGEINQPEVLFDAPVLPPAETKPPQPQQKTADSATDAKIRQEILIKEVLEMSRESLSKQGIEPNAEAWIRYADDISRNAPNEKAPVSKMSHLKWAQRSVPQSERVNLEKVSRLEATHLILKLSPEIFQKQFVENRLEKYERQIAAERGEIKPPVILPAIEKSAIRAIEVEPTQETSVISDVKPESAKVERSEIKIELAREETIVVDTKSELQKVERDEIEIEPAQQKPIVSGIKPEVEREEIKPPVVMPAVEKSATPEITTEPARGKVVPTGDELHKRQEILTTELVQLSRESVAKQNIEHGEDAWSWLENVRFSDLATQKIPLIHKRYLGLLQKDLPDSERVNLSGKSRLESTHAILKLLPDDKSGARDKMVNSFFAGYERQKVADRNIEQAPERAATLVPDAKPAVVEVERIEIKPTVTLPVVGSSPTPEIKTQSILENVSPIGDEPENREEILIREVLQMSRDSLAKQSIEPNAKAWKFYADDITNDSPNQKASESQEQYLEFLQEDLPPLERIGLAGKSRLETAHAIMKLAPDESRDAIVKKTFSTIEKQVATERQDIIKPEIKEVAKTASFEKAVFKEVKPTPKVRNFEAIEREELIRELVAAARDEARTWKGEDFSYRQEKRLTKMYRQAGDNLPTEQQVNGLSSLQERFSAPLPQPKNFIEATVLTLDNSTGAEKSAGLRGQIQGLNELIKSEEAAASNQQKAIITGDEMLLRGEVGYFQQEIVKPYFDNIYRSLAAEAQGRGFATDNAGDVQMTIAISQMEIANRLQNQINESLSEQGIKIRSSAQTIMKKSVDDWANQPPTVEEINEVLKINQGGAMPANRLEANDCIYQYGDIKERDEISSSLAAAATQKAVQTETQQRKEEQERTQTLGRAEAQEMEQAKELTEENSYDFDEGQTQTRGHSM